jgi:hypothetical protein
MFSYLFEIACTSKLSWIHERFADKNMGKLWLNLGLKLLREKIEGTC